MNQPEQSPRDIISPQEFHMATGSIYGLIIGQLIAEKLSLEKQNQALQSRLNDTEEIAFGLKQDNANLIKNQVACEDKIHRLESEIADLIKAGPTADQIAAQGREIIANETEKAASVGAACS